jgi:hypothetical protein
MKNLLKLSVLAILIASCGLPIQGPKKTVLPSFKFELDTSAMTPELFGGASPVGSVTMDFINVQGQAMMSFCTGFLISPTLVLTNQHCIYDDVADQLSSASNLSVYFRNPGDAKTTELKIKYIVDYDRVEAASREERQFMLDWALLEIDGRADRFGAVSLIEELPALEKVTTNLPLTIARINPPEEGGRVAVFDPVSAELNTGVHFTQEAKSNASEDIRRECKTNKSYFSAEYKACNELTVTDGQIYEKLKTQKSEALVDTAIRHGNSGSPVVLDGKVLGIAHSGLFSLTDVEEKGDTEAGLMQFLFPISDRLSRN